MPPSPRFWNRIAKRYAKSPVSDEVSYQKKLSQTQAYFTPETEVFEFGCGTGTTALHHAEYVKHIDAIDISPKMLEIAKSKARVAGVENIYFVTGTIEGFDETVQEYDVVMGHSILHLVEDRLKVLGKVSKMLKPGGVFVSSTACLGGTMAWLKLILPLGSLLGLLPVVKFFTPDQLTEDIKAFGFDIEVQWQPSKTQGLFIIARKQV